MTMEIHDVIQGSPEWLALRSQYDTASEAPAMMGASKYQTRADLLRQKATGYTPPVDGAKQALFDRGHITEAAARALVEDMIGEDLYPVTGSRGRLLASYDGVIMDGTVGFEHKLYSESLAAQVRAKELEPHYYWQLEQEILVGDLEKVIFVCSDGTPDKFVHMEYRAVPGRAEQLVAGWKQFNEDLASYQHVEVLPAAVATEQPSLPAVIVRMGGALTVDSNLPDFSIALRQYIKTIPERPSTDQEFADCEAACKSLKKAEDALQQAEDSALAGMTDVEAMRRVVAELRALARATRLASEKMVEARKVTIRDEIRVEFSKAAADHLTSLNLRIGKEYMPAVPVDFAGAMKGKKTITSLRDACSQSLATFKIAASAIADGIQANMKYAGENAADYKFLFADMKTIVLKAADDFQSTLTSRIATHKLDEARKEQERKDREAAEAKRLDDERIAREAREAIAKAATPAVQAAPVPDTPAATPVPAASTGYRAGPPTFVRRDAPPVVPDTPPTLRMGVICDRLGFIINADFVAQLGIEPPKRDNRNLPLFHESQFAEICRALIQHIETIAELAPA